MSYSYQQTRNTSFLRLLLLFYIFSHIKTNLEFYVKNSPNLLTFRKKDVIIILIIKYVYIKDKNKIGEMNNEK